MTFQSSFHTCQKRTEIHHTALDVHMFSGSFIYVTELFLSVDIVKDSQRSMPLNGSPKNLKLHLLAIYVMVPFSQELQNLLQTDASESSSESWNGAD